MIVPRWEWRAFGAEVEPAEQRLGAQAAERRDVGQRVAVHDDEVRVVTRRQPPGHGSGAERFRGRGGGHGDNVRGPEAQLDQVLQATGVLVVRGVVDPGVGPCDDPYPQLVHGHQVLAHRDPGQLNHVRGVHVDGRADGDALFRNPGRERLVEPPLVGLGHERAVLQRADPGLDRPAGDRGGLEPEGLPPALAALAGGDLNQQ